MASLRLLVLAFVRDYIEHWQESPSYGEIAHATDHSKMRVRDAVKSLVAEGLLLRTPGPRGLALPDARDEAIRRLRDLGWRVDADLRIATPDLNDPYFTLHGVPVLDYDPEDGQHDGRYDGGANGAFDDRIDQHPRKRATKGR